MPKEITLADIKHQPQVTVLRALLATGDLPDVFVLHGSTYGEREKVAEALRNDLRQLGYRVGIDPYQLKITCDTVVSTSSDYKPFVSFYLKIRDFSLLNPPVGTNPEYALAVDLTARLVRSNPQDVVEKSVQFVQTYSYSALVEHLTYVVNNILLYQIGVTTAEPNAAFKALFAVVDKSACTLALKKLWDSSEPPKLSEEVAGSLLSLFLADILNPSFDLSAANTPITTVEDVPLTFEEMERMARLAVEGGTDDGQAGTDSG